MQVRDERIVIASSKFKLILLTVGSFLFVLLGIWLFEHAGVQTRRPPLFVKGMRRARFDLIRHIEDLLIL